MGYVSSNPLDGDDEFRQLGSSALGHHVVSLTSTTYGLLTLDPVPPPLTPPLPPPPPPPPPHSEPRTPPSLRSDPEVINSWELMAGLDTDSFRFFPFPQPPKSSATKKSDAAYMINDKENSDPNQSVRKTAISGGEGVLKPLKDSLRRPSLATRDSLEGFEKRCPPNGENRVVVYTTSVRGVRRTFEACAAVMTAIEGLGVWVCERDISMDRGFREELRELMKGKESGFMIPPRVFVKGRYLGGAEEVLRMAEEGFLSELLDGLPKNKGGVSCEGCGGVRFLPCFRCNGSCKLVMVVKENAGQKRGRKVVVVRCSECNENGLVLCPICS
ncbi:uncharacterized protein At5g39865-like [Malania oleifera]|uniref:uncharacterized protein At5g39865-like n=1 Tax=Malania oleifera TaxID=397392 RepID=UPI0025ADF763|nr:uncharacterized protein At5g39865-like [Malania oleifera]